MEDSKFKILTREDKGKQISKNPNIVKTSNGWRIPSESNPNKKYLVKEVEGKLSCNCYDYCNKKNKCKHVFAIEFFIEDIIAKEKNIDNPKKTYGQNWSTYNNYQINEKRNVLKALRDLCDIKQPKYNFGRPRLPFSDMLFGAILKVYTGFSLRRFMSDMEIAKEMGLIEKVPCYSSLSNFMNKKEISEILIELIKFTASPLKDVETVFAVDSSGFSTSRFARWFDYKWGEERKYKVWIKAHISIGVMTNIVAGVTITSGTSSDSNEFEELIKQTAENFNITEVSGDKAYISRKNLEIVGEHGATPFIPFKSNVTGNARGSYMWKKMYHQFSFHNEEFMKHYNKRSNVETTFHMIKSKFGDSVCSKKEVSQVNELLMKIICHNIVCIIRALYDLNISSNFGFDKHEIQSV